nr:polyprotein [Rhizoctonia zeae hypovirus 2]
MPGCSTHASPVGEEDVSFEPDVLRRPNRVPLAHRGTPGEIAGLDDLLPEGFRLVTTDEWIKRVSRYLELGAEQGIDAIYLEREEKRYASIHRYEGPMLGDDPNLRAKATDAAITLKEKYADVFPAVEVSTPESVVAYENLKFSPGLPLLGRYRSRREAYSHGWGQSISQAVRKAASEGIYPTQLHHMFPKSQVVPVRKALEKIRTVVAEDKLAGEMDQAARFHLTKVPAWETGDISIGAPLTEPYFRDAFYKIMDHVLLMEGDITDADANLPAFVIDGLLELARNRGIDALHSAAIEAVSAAHYKSLCTNSFILDLASTKWYEKTRGFGTGQSSTSWDNTWAVKILMMVGFSEVTGLPVGEFFKWCDFINTGDDNLWGCSLPGFKREEFVNWMDQELGIKFKINSGRLTDLTYLSRKLVPLSPGDESEYLSRGMPIPEHKIITDTGAILTRRTAWKARPSGFGSLKFTHYLLDTHCGHILHSGWNPTLYSLIAEEYMHDVRSLLHRSNVAINAKRDPETGYVTQVNCINLGGDPRVAKVLRTHRLPSYREVMNMHLRPGKVVKTDSRKTRFARWLAPPPSWALKAFAFLRSATDTGPYAAMHRLGPEPDFAPLTARFTGSHYTVAGFVWGRFLEKKGMGSFLARGRETPFASAEDWVGFEILMAIPEFSEKYWGPDPARKARQLRVKVVLIIVVYWFLHYMISRVRVLPYVWILGELWLIWIIDRPRLYQLLNLLFWMLVGYSSPLISSMIPKDAYVTLKQIAVVIADLVPTELMPDIDLDPVEAVVVWILERAAQVTTGAEDVMMSFKTAIVGSNPWNELVKSYYDLARHGDRPVHVALKSATSTGKSSYHIAALNWFHVSRGSPKKVWLIMPTHATRDEASLGGLFSPDQVQRLKAGIPYLPGPDVSIMTAGHALAEIASGHLSPDVVVVIDEAHYNQPEQVLLALEVKGKVDLIAMTATFEGVLGHADAMTFDTNLQRRTRLELRQARSSDVLDCVFEAEIEKPDLFESLLIIIPSLLEAEAVNRSLRQMNVDSAVWASGMPLPRKPVIVATQVAEAGIDIPKPGVKYVIDSGRTVRSHRGTLYTSFVEDVGTWMQRAGRAGRHVDGVAWRCHQPLGDITAVPYPPALVLILEAHGKEYASLLGIEEDSWPSPFLVSDPRPFAWALPVLHDVQRLLPHHSFDVQVLYAHAPLFFESEDDYVNVMSNWFSPSAVREELHHISRLIHSRFNHIRYFHNHPSKAVLRRLYYTPSIRVQIRQKTFVTSRIALQGSTFVALINHTPGQRH